MEIIQPLRIELVARRGHAKALAVHIATAGLILQPLMSATLEFLLTLGSVATWAYAGTLARVGLDWIEAHTRTTIAASAGPIGSDFLANIAGSFIMGVLVSLAFLKTGRAKLIYTGMTSGFCGSLTTFSGWQVQASISLLKPAIVDGLLDLVVGISTFYASFRVGYIVGKTSFAYISSKNKKQGGNDENQVELSSLPRSGQAAPSAVAASAQSNQAAEPNPNLLIPETKPSSPPQDKLTTQENVFSAVLSIVLLVVFGLLFIFVKSSRAWTGPAFFAPWGAGTRWFLSRWTPHWPRFRMPTFFVNVVGVFFYAVLYVCQKKYGPNSALLQSFLTSLSSGVCGTLTTVSTFVVELRDIRPIQFAYFYGGSSVVVSQAIALIVLGVGKARHVAV